MTKINNTLRNLFWRAKILSTSAMLGRTFVFPALRRTSDFLVMFRKAMYSKTYDTTRRAELSVELKCRSTFKTVSTGTLPWGRTEKVNAIIETMATKILARLIVIQLLYFVGRKTAMKQSTAKAKTIPNEILSVSNENEEPTLARFSRWFRPKNRLYSTAAKIGATIAPVKTFAVDIASRNKDDGVRKLLSGSTQPVKTKRPLPNTVNGDKIILYTATISSSVPAGELE